MNCRPGCGACCTAPSISSPIPGVAAVNGISKPAGVRCVHLLFDQRCGIFGHADRPAVCSSLMPSLEMCGDTREHAVRWLTALERDTTPSTQAL
ncbi:MAG: YkgJ family cysteine cluster protein [Pseudorhodobacter sp.]|nr:YkgJ family cysteine cluster protein [Rhizobacter sp.]